jgi:hypothetical protein
MLPDFEEFSNCCLPDILSKLIYYFEDMPELDTRRAWTWQLQMIKRTMWRRLKNGYEVEQSFDTCTREERGGLWNAIEETISIKEVVA